MKVRKRRFHVMLFALAALAISALAGDIEQHFRGQTETFMPVTHDWRSDERLQNHGITEVSFERPESADRTRWEAYTVKFYSDGRVEYTGYDYVRKLGDHVGRIPITEFNRLVLLIDTLDFDGLELMYHRNALSSWTNYTSVVKGGQRKTIQNYADTGPVQLWAIELAIQDLVRKITWES
jgi:hypothetical protein